MHIAWYSYGKANISIVGAKTPYSTNFGCRKLMGINLPIGFFLKAFLLETLYTNTFLQRCAYVDTAELHHSNMMAATVKLHHSNMTVATVQSYM